MTLQVYKTLWGHDADFAQACEQAVAAGFDGIEGPAPLDAEQSRAWRARLASHNLAYIAEIATGGSYVPDRRVSLQGHLDDFARKLEASLALQPEFVTCLGGCDAWPESQSLEFFARAMDLAAASQVTVSFETHRGRIFFNPWVTERLCRALPALKLTCDFSHWCVVCERLFDADDEQLAAVFSQAFHIHARVGYDQGPQVPDPSSPLYARAVSQHELWWQRIWATKADKGESITMTPEFGPDGYQAVDPRSGDPVGDLWEMNCWMADRQRHAYEQFQHQ